MATYHADGHRRIRRTRSVALTGTVEALPGGGALGIAEEVSTAVTVSRSMVVLQRSAWRQYSSH